MKKKLWAGLVTGLFMVGMSGMAQATLITIGQATYYGGDYNLIWDDDNNGNSVVWLDFTNFPNNWSAQNGWAAALDSALTYNIDAAYTVDWATNEWRLPTTVDGPYLQGYDGTTTAGYNITSSEMGHLYYEELGNLEGGYGLQNTGDFDNLTEFCYWSGTETAYNYIYMDPLTDYAWVFDMGLGWQDLNVLHNLVYGLALRSGQVSADPVPEPATIVLFGTGLAALVGYNRKRKGIRA